MHLGERQGIQRTPPRGQFLVTLAPARHRIRLVQPHGRGDRIPQALGIRLAEHFPCPARVWSRHDGPAQPLYQERVLVGHRLLHRECGGLGRVDIVEQMRIGVAGEHDRDPSCGSPLTDPLQGPRPRPGERLDAGVSKPRVPDRPVGPVDLDPFGAGSVGVLHHGPGDIEMRNVSTEQNTHARPHVRADTDNQIGETVNAIVAGHAGSVGHIWRNCHEAVMRAGEGGARRRSLRLVSSRWVWQG